MEVVVEGSLGRGRPPAFARRLPIQLEAARRAGANMLGHVLDVGRAPVQGEAKGEGEGEPVHHVLEQHPQGHGAQREDDRTSQPRLKWLRKTCV